MRKVALFAALAITTLAAHLYVLHLNQRQVAELHLAEQLRQSPAASVQTIETANLPERFRIGELTQADNYEEFTPVLQAPPPPVANGAEIAVVSGYEARGARNGNRTVAVTVNRPGRTVVLILSSYEGILWQVTATTGTNIQFIALSSYDSDSQVATSASIPVHKSDLGYVYDSENVNFLTLLESLASMGIDGIDSFVGSYGLPASITVDTMESLPQWQRGWSAVTSVPVDMQFELPGIDNATPVPFSLHGPATNPDAQVQMLGTVAVADDGRRYTISERGLLITSDGQQQEVRVPPNFPEFSWPSGIAYDSDNKLVSVVSFGGDGAFYRFDTSTNAWKDFRTLGGIDISSLVYDASTHGYLGLGTFDADLMFINQLGVPVEQHRLTDVLPGYGRFYDRGNGPEPALAIIPQGDDIALLLVRGNYVRAIWYYNKSLKKAALTYQR